TPTPISTLSLHDALPISPPPPPPPPSPPPPPFTRPKCVVPNVLHLKLAKARAKIRKRHCGVGKITKKHSSATNKGRVIKQSPKRSEEHTSELQSRGHLVC